jgi:hypothetical protein
VEGGIQVVDGQAAEKMGTEARGERAECCGVEEAPGVWKESGEVLKARSQLSVNERTSLEKKKAVFIGFLP